MLESRAARRLGEARPYFGPMRFAMCLALGDDTGKEQRRCLSCSSIAGDAQWLSTLPACQATGGARRQVRVVRAPGCVRRRRRGSRSRPLCSSRSASSWGCSCFCSTTSWAACASCSPDGGRPCLEGWRRRAGPTIVLCAVRLRLLSVIVYMVER